MGFTASSCHLQTMMLMYSLFVCSATSSKFSTSKVDAEMDSSLATWLSVWSESAIFWFVKLSWSKSRHCNKNTDSDFNKSTLNWTFHVGILIYWYLTVQLSLSVLGRLLPGPSEAAVFACCNPSMVLMYSLCLASCERDTISWWLTAAASGQVCGRAGFLVLVKG